MAFTSWAPDKPPRSAVKHAAYRSFSAVGRTFSRLGARPTVPSEGRARGKFGLEQPQSGLDGRACGRRCRGRGTADARSRAQSGRSSIGRAATRSSGARCSVERCAARHRRLSQSVVQPPVEPLARVAAKPSPRSRDGAVANPSMRPLREPRERRWTTPSRRLGDHGTTASTRRNEPPERRQGRVASRRPRALDGARDKPSAALAASPRCVRAATLADPQEGALVHRPARPRRPLRGASRRALAERPTRGSAPQ